MINLAILLSPQLLFFLINQLSTYSNSTVRQFHIEINKAATESADCFLFTCVAVFKVVDVGVGIM